MQKFKLRNILYQSLSKIFPAVFWILIIFAFDMPYVAILTLISALIHELGHIIATVFLNGGFDIRSGLSGLRLSFIRRPSYLEEAIIAAAGPIANIVTAFTLLLIFKTGSYIYVFSILNLLTAISNLLPIESYDGYRILSCITEYFELGETASSLLLCLSLTIEASILTLALYLIRSFGAGHWIFFVFIALLIKSIKNDKRAIFERKREEKRDF